MPKTLKGALPLLQADLTKALTKASYEAFMTTMNGGGDKTMGPVIEKQITQAGVTFANKFAQELAEPLSKAIYNFTKEMGIILTPSGSLIAPQAVSGALPVTGTSPMQDFKII